MSDYAPAAIKPLVSMAAVEALDVRLGTIRHVRDVPDSKKLTALLWTTQIPGESGIVTAPAEVLSIPSVETFEIVTVNVVPPS